ncbi:hypothetical protein [Candidatus Binatus sp.]|uniref:hypothetical protein n=1 Tax=Candidatus Binatus sp. TaxID=2811406 RepID=UPI003CC58E56
MAAKIKRAVTLTFACAIALAGCSHETQQQKFMDAMTHGNSAQASQIWLHMDAQSRADFSHNEGMTPNTSPDDVKKQVMEHYQDKMGGGDEEDSDESVEKPTPNVHLGGLESLPEWVGPTGAPPQAVTVPAKTEPPPSN